MKKFISIFLALLFVLALAACGTNTATTSPSPAASPSAAPSPSPSAAPSSAAPSSAAPASTSADDDWAYIKAKGELVIGYTDYAPMNYTDDSGKLVGFDTEYAEAVCKLLGVTPKFVLINWDTKEVELQSKNIDCIWNGLTIDDERKQNMAITDPYIRNEQVLIVKSSDASKYTDKASLSGKNVVAETESAGQTAIENDLSSAKFTAVDSQAKALLEVKAGTADAAVIDATMAEAMTGSGTDYADLAVITSLNLTSEEYGIAFRLGSNAAAEVNKATQSLLQDGTMAKIAEKYELTERLITK
jgi:polar amino acid transport system substrate-binding protein